MTSCPQRFSRLEYWMFCVYLLILGFSTAIAFGQTGQLSLNETSPVSITTAGQEAQFTFSGTGGQTVNLFITNSTFSGCSALTATILNPDGSQLNSQSACGSGSIGFSQLSLPQMGVYTITLAPGPNGTGTASITLSTDQTGQQLVASQPFTVAINTPGQNAQFTFNGAAGQEVNVEMTNSTLGACYVTTLTLLAPDGLQVGSTGICGTGGLSFTSLPENGTYTVVLNPYGGTGSAMLYLSSDQVTSVVSGQAAEANLATPGENSRFLFSGVPGQQGTVTISGSTFSGCGYLTVSVLNPDGTVLASTSLCYSSNASLTPLVLTQAGTYTILLSPYGGRTGSSTVEWSMLSTAASPTFSPSPGSYEATQNVTISDATASASIYYTTDGSVPTTSSSLYTQPIPVTQSETIQAIATAPNTSVSSSASASYVLSIPPVLSALAPSAALQGGMATIVGSHFGPTQGNGIVSLGGIQVAVSSWSDTRIQIHLPTTATSGLVVVTTQYGVSNELPLQIQSISSGYVRPITISHLQVPNTDQTNFPVLISGTYPFLATVPNGGRVLNTSGYDIVFTYDAAGQNLLPFEIDNYNAVTGAAGFWVQVPTVSHTTDTTIFMWYGLPGITQSQENTPGVWSNGYAAVWHMGDGTTLSTGDSTGINITTTNIGVTPGPGFIGGAGSFNNQTSASYLQVASNPSFKPAANLTLEAWFNASSINAWNKIIGLDYRADGSWNSPYLAYALQNYASTNTFSLQVTEGGSGPAIATPNPYSLNTWNQVVGTYDGNQMLVYLNAVPSQPFEEEGPIDYGTSLDLTIGARSPYSIYNGEGWQGLLDEVRISSVTRSPDWVSTEYNNESNVAGFYSVGAELSGTGTPVPIIQSITTAPYGSGSVATILGLNFGAIQGTSTVTLDGTVFRVRSWSSTMIRVDEPNVHATGMVIVTVNSASSFPLPYPIATIPQITWNTPTPITLGTALSMTQLNAMTSTPGSFVYSPSLGTVLPLGTTQLTVTFIPTDPVNYTSASATNQIAVVPSVPLQLPQPGRITTIAGNGFPGYTGDGTAATTAELDNPYGVAVDSLGNIYIPDTINNAIRKVSATTGLISTVVGTSSRGYSGDGGPAASATLNYPYSVTLNAAGDLYIADTGNNVIRKVSAGSGIISTVAGTGPAGYAGDGGPAILGQLTNPTSVALDLSGNVYVADWQNNAVREINAATGIINTVAGTGASGSYGDGGPAIAAQLNQPFGIALDSSGNLYIADSGNNRIRQVLAATGIITSVAGNGVSGYSGDGESPTSAQLNYPTGILIDGSGNIDISDTQNSVIRQVNSSRAQIATLAGTGASGYTGDGSSALTASFNMPTGIAVDRLDNLYLVDSSNNVIRVVGSTLPSSGNAPRAPTGGHDTIMITGSVQTTNVEGQPLSDSGTLTVSLISPSGTPVTVTVPWGTQDTRLTLAKSLAVAVNASSSEVRALALANRVQIYSTITGLPAPLAIAISQANNPQFSLPSLIGELLDSSPSANILPIAPFCPGSQPPPALPGQHVLYSLPTSVPPQPLTAITPATNGSGIACLFSPSPWWWDVIDTLEGQPPDINEGCPTYNANPTQIVASVTQTNAGPLGNTWWGEQFTQFQPVQLPANAVVQGIYGVETGTTSGSYSYAVMNLGGSTPLDGAAGLAYSENISGTGSCYTSNLAPPYGNLTIDQIPSLNLNDFMFQTTPFGQINAELDISYAALATYFTIDTPPITTIASLSMTDPYLLPNWNSGPFDASSVIKNYLNASAGGIIQDGVSTSIAVFSTNVKQDVTFDIDDSSGATLLDWDPNFLNPPLGQPLPAGTGEKFVPAANLFPVNGVYYAFILVQSPTGRSNGEATSTVTLEACQQPGQASCKSEGDSAQVAYQPASLTAYPRPVLLVHGLWGNRHSLRNVWSYLAAYGPWKQQWMITPVCYSTVLPFDYPYPGPLPDTPEEDADPFVSTDDSCEHSATFQIYQGLKEIQQHLNNAVNGPIVGGQVDLVVHSMGGLVARNYITLPQYNSPANRRQGLFNTVVTIDTPEQGSPLANYLLAMASSPMNVSLFQKGGWLSKLGCSASKVLADCFKILKLPIGPPSPLPGCTSTYLCSAVSSIAVQSPDLHQLPQALPALTGGWTGLSAVWADDAQDSTSMPNYASILRFVVQSLIDTVNNGNGPTVSSLFSVNGDYVPNDVIVSQASQEFGLSIPARPYQQKAHSATPKAEYLEGLASAITGYVYSNDNVEDDNDGVNPAVLCVLTNSGNPHACGNNSAQDRQLSESHTTKSNSESGGVQVQGRTRGFAADDRLEIVAPTGSLRLGMSNRIGVRIHGVGLKKVYTLQSGYDESTQSEDFSIDENGSAATVVTVNGELFIEVKPLALGKEKIILSATFADGAIATRDVEVEVAPPGVPAEGLFVPGTADGRLLVTLPRNSHAGAERGVSLEAVYAGLEQRIVIHHRFIEYRVLDSKTVPSISVNPVTGMITPRAKGHSLLSMSFDGNTAFTCVVVQDSDQAVPDRSNCDELLPPGGRLTESAESFAGPHAN